MQAYEMTNRISITAFILTAFSGLWAHPAHAQGTATRLVPIPNPATMVLRSPEVWRELALSGSQTAAVNSQLGEVERALWQLRDDAPEMRNQKALALLAPLKGMLDSVLSPFQMQRYQEILFQAQGVGILLDPQIVQRLSLTSGQTQEISMILTSLQTTLSRMSPGQKALSIQAQTRAERELFGVLNGVQRQNWRSLLGVPFDFSSVPQRAFKVPEFLSVDTWINAAPLTMAQSEGKVVVVHFYTYGCINCVRNLPHYNDWYKRYAARGVQVIGVHRPESSGESHIESVKKKAVDAGIQYPVAVDNQAANWNAWGTRVWPSAYLVDKQGFVRFWWVGELNWQSTRGEAWMRDRIEALLQEPAGDFGYL
jgi:peroxiredoxin